jgi:hypothetical protein
MSERDLTALISSASRPGGRRGRCCPDEERLAAFVEGTLAETARETVTDHLTECEFCCGQVAFLVRAAELDPPPAVPAALLALAHGERASLVRHLRPAAVLAAAFTVVASMLVLVQRERPGFLPNLPDDAGSRVATPAPPPAERTVRNGRVPAEAPAIVRPAEGEVVSRAAVELRWRDAPGALFYTVQLVDSRGDVAWEARSEGTSLAVPPAAALTPGQRYFAWVIAHLSSGATVRSPAVGFRLAPG